MKATRGQMEVVERYFRNRYPTFQQVHYIIKHAFLYQFDGDWVDTGVGGRGYCFRLLGDPRPRLLIFDQRTPNATEVAVEKHNTTIERDGKFLMLGKSTGHTGIWFDLRADADRVYDLLSGRKTETSDVCDTSPLLL